MSDPSSIRAVRFHEYGDPSVLVLEEVPRPAPGAGEVLLRVRAVGIHPMDWKLRSGQLREYMPLELPHVLGWEVAGTVEELGEDVTDLQPGEAVFGRGNAAYAELAVAPVAMLARKPEAMSFEEAATFGLSGVTAWNAVEALKLQPGQTVLVHGGAGGVGSLVVQLARRKGAHVIATTSAANAGHVHGLGADQVIDYSAGPFEERVAEVDAVLDAVGGDVLERSWATLRKGGVLVTIAGRPDPERAAAHGVRVGTPDRPETTAPILAELAKLVAAGQLRPALGDTFALADAAEAHAAAETGHGRGRRVLRVTS